MTSNSIEFFAVPSLSFSYLSPSSIKIWICRLSIVFLFQNTFFFLFRSRVFSRALRCGARRGPACLRRCKCGCRPGSMARVLWAFKVAESGESPRNPFRGGRAEQDNGNPTFQFFLLHFCFCSAVVQPRSHLAQAYLCVCARCVCVCVRVCVGLCMCVLQLGRASFGLRFSVGIDT